MGVGKVESRSSYEPPRDREMTIFDVDRWVGGAINALAGRSSLLDTLVALPMRNEFVKAVPLAACFFVAWFAGAPEEKTKRRGILLVALVAALAATGVSRLISEKNALPRPYAFSQSVYRLDGGVLVEQPLHALRMPLDNTSVERANRLRAGNVPPNDFGSFPSDHASLFFTIALGLALAWPRCGFFALGWTGIAILLPKLWTGLHSPLDVIGGMLLGTAMLGLFLVLQRRTLAEPARRLANWTVRYDALAAGVLFAVLFEMCATFEHVTELARGIANRLL